MSIRGDSWMNDDKQDSVTVCIRMSAAEKERLAKLADAESRSLSSYIRVILAKNTERAPA